MGTSASSPIIVCKLSVPRGTTHNTTRVFIMAKLKNLLMLFYSISNHELQDAANKILLFVQSLSGAPKNHLGLHRMATHTFHTAGSVEPE